jgi:hypothetical protein
MKSALPREVQKTDNLASDGPLEAKSVLNLVHDLSMLLHPKPKVS